jgi:hypothetical protein
MRLPIRPTHASPIARHLLALGGLTLASVGCAIEPLDEEEPASDESALSISVPVDSGQTDPDVILSTVAFTVAERPVYVRLDQLTLRVSSWGAGAPTNVGTTTRVRCYDASNREIMAPHFGANIVRSGLVSPQVHAMITAPGNYTCKVAVQAYSTAWARGMKLAADTTTMRFTATAQRPGSMMWSHPGDVGIAKNRGVMRFTRDFFGLPDSKVVFVVDQQFTNCNEADAQRNPQVCAGAVAAAAGGRFRLYTSITPLHADGSVCGPEVRSTEDADISQAAHHRTLIASMTYEVPVGCAGIRAQAGMALLDGDKGWVHAPANYGRAVMIL